MNTRNYLLALATVVAIAVAHYFLVSLPNLNQAKLALEHERQDADRKEKQAAKSAAAKKQQDAAAALSNCRDATETKYWNYVRLNGFEDSDGTLKASDKVWNRADREKKADLNECYRRYRTEK